MSETEAPKKKKRHIDDEVHHPIVHDESNWLVSYADMMTLLFGFFVIMYSISKIDQTKYTVVAKDFAKYFGGKVEAVSTQNQAQAQIEGLLKTALPQGSYQVAVIPTGVSIKFNSNILFAPGSAKLNPDMYPVLSGLVDTLLKYKEIDSIQFEGHTDDDPISSPYFPTNWELSAARATRILRQFESSGFKSEMLVAKGHGSSRPEVPNRDESGRALIENQKQNRRVVINIDMTTKSKEAINELSKKDFKVVDKLPVEEKNETAPTDDAMDTEESLRQRMEMAQDKLKSINEKIRENITKQKKRQAVLDLEKKVKDLEKKAKETEEGLVSPPKK